MKWEPVSTKFRRFVGLTVHVGSITASSGLESSFVEADGTRSTQDVRRPLTKRSGESQIRTAIRCAQWNASRAAAWRRRRVAVARPVRIDFCTNLRFFLARSEIGQVTELSTPELVRLPKWSLCFPSKNGLTRATSRCCLQR